VKFSTNPESTRQKVFAAIAADDKYRNGNYNELAERFGTSYGTIRNLACVWRQKPAAGTTTSAHAAATATSAAIPGAGDTTFKQDGNSAEYAFKTDKRIQTLQDLVDACEIDLSVWDVERWVCNKWEVGAKNAALEIEVTPLFQVKVWLKAKRGKTFFELKDQLLEEMRAFAPRYPAIIRRPLKEKHLFVVCAADPHFGKYSSQWETGDGYDLKKAEERYHEGVEGLIQKVRHYPIDKVVLIGGNDKMHVDSPHNVTTSGTRQDTDGMWFEHHRAAKRAEIGAVDRLLSVADVHYVHCPSNHDYQTGFFFADSIQSWYHRNKNITFDISPRHRKYMQYGTSLIGMSHGDGAKEEILPDLMAKEARQAWAQTRYGYWYLHHIHHKDKKGRKGKEKIQMEKDKVGVTILHTNLEVDPEDYCHVEYLRSISATDSWHHRNGYQGSFKAMEAFIHHPVAGQINRLIHLF
jgi:hypothetical protein